MKDLLTQSGFDLPKIGDILEGEIISANKHNVFIDLGHLGTGIIYPGEFYAQPSMQKALKPGQTVSAVLIDIETEDGFRELSLKQARQTSAWQEIKKLKDSGEVITTPIVNINKGGAIVEIHGIQGFLPLSQLAPEHYPKVEGGDTTKIVQHLQKLKSKELNIKILDFNEEESKLIVSEKAVGDENLKKAIELIKVGDIVEGTVTGVTDFGAFVSLAAPTLTESEAGAPTENVGTEAVTAETPSSVSPFAKATEDKETTRPSPKATADTAEGGRKEEGSAEENPEVHEKNGGEGEIDTDTKELPAIEGLIHISEIDWKLVENPRDYLRKGQNITAKVIDIDGTKVSLSLKALKPDPWADIDKKYSVGRTVEVTITKVNNYGALAALSDEIIGLIPVSEFAGKRPQEVFRTGDKTKAAIVSIDVKEHKMILTMASIPPGGEETAEKNESTKTNGQK